MHKRSKVSLSLAPFGRGTLRERATQHEVKAVWIKNPGSTGFLPIDATDARDKIKMRIPAQNGQAMLERERRYPRIVRWNRFAGCLERNQ